MYYNCRSSIIQLSKEEVKDLGLEITEDYPNNDDRFSDYRYLVNSENNSKIKNSYIDYSEEQEKNVKENIDVINKAIKNSTFNYKEKERKNYKISDDDLIKKIWN